MEFLGPKFYSANDVNRCLSNESERLIEVIEESFVTFSTKQAGFIQPQRMAVNITEYNSLMMKPCISLSNQIASFKILTINQLNEINFGLPVIQGVIVVFDTISGSVNAIVDAISVTDRRTAAASAVAIKHLCKESDTILAIIGTGHQGASHVQLLSAYKKFSEIRVFSRTKENCHAFAKKYNCIPCDSVKNAVKDADIIVTATTSISPVLFKKWIKHGCLIIAVGAPLCNQRELDDEIMLTSQIFTDTEEGAYASAGDVILSNAKIHGELGNVINKTINIDWNTTRVFKSNGMAVQDLVTVKLILDKDKEKKDLFS
ncbi:ketimine reductase mu-crystallin [Hydra vulgaris]|uniref:Ketimine reductase mu-crystallin n=1 Tax=Hydra vulgaris TaxID=6087 RepID=T2MD85_HYDVU|nr:ketimine reductase mu-crystallin [Hydra vulgaris]